MNPTPYHFLKTTVGVWRLEQLGPQAWALKWKRAADLSRKPPIPYALARSFGKPEDAVTAVMDNRTGIPEWDRAVRTAPREFYAFSNWQTKEPV